MRQCQVTVWEPGVEGSVPYQYSAPEGCEVEHGKGVLFQNEVGPGADIEYEVEVWNPTNQDWDVLRARANRSAA